MKVAIVVITYNIDTRILILQLGAIKKYCKDEDYNVEIVDNSSDEEQAEAIKYYADEFKASYRRIRCDNPDPSRSHSFAANYSYRVLRDLYDVFFYLDHDCIPVKEFSVEEILEDKIVAGVRSGMGIKYFWPGCLMWNNTLVDRELISFSPINSLSADTGGGFYKLIEKYGDEGCKYFDEIGCENPYFVDTPLYYFYIMIYKETFMHFINASGWNPTENNDQRLNSLINIATNRINGDE